jgi:hypothetical protein
MEETKACPMVYNRPWVISRLILKNMHPGLLLREYGTAKVNSGKRLHAP